jgi:hypothetical protein
MGTTLSLEAGVDPAMLGSTLVAEAELPEPGIRPKVQRVPQNTTLLGSTPPLP